MNPTILEYYCFKATLTAKTNLTQRQIETVCWYYGDLYSRNPSVKTKWGVKN